MSSITIMNSVFPLSYDDASDARGVWTWDELTPLCPSCLKAGKIHPLLAKQDTKQAPVENDGPSAAKVTCDCCTFSTPVTL